MNVYNVEQSDAQAALIAQEFIKIRAEMSKTVVLTQVQYDALPLKDGATIYIINNK